MFLKDKKGASLVELIAVILILGIIASVAIPTTITLINRQRRNAIINSLNEIYKSAKSLLVQVASESYDPNIIVVDEDFCYISLTTLIDSGNVDGAKYKPQNNEIYYCYNMTKCWVVISNAAPEENIPTSTGVAIVNSFNVTFDYEEDEFDDA